MNLLLEVVLRPRKFCEPSISDHRKRSLDTSENGFKGNSTCCKELDFLTSGCLISLYEVHGKESKLEVLQDCRRMQ